ncbi:hypothetical protein HPB49_004152 [Dermacentor silvarum]|uniref:Uncharacterized protein n=1 Tax=Dermacentor silvarum TaxID=543639 RepID=A0ACB8DU97_DERSI|nr:hypothetical protein HPB49_004152 [Dermacentor silvarum]
MAAPARSCARVHFTADVDILVLRETSAINPFEDVSRWALMSENLLRAIQRNLSPHCLRDRVDLLLAQFAARDRANLRKSGTEEEYNEKEKLLAEVYELAKESGYKLKPSAIRKVSAARRQQQQQHSKSRRPASDKGIASAVRDLAASEIATESDGTDDGVPMAHEAAACEDDNLWSTNVYDVAEASAAEPLHGDYEVLAAAPGLDASASVPIIYISVLFTGKGHADPHLQFFEKRLHVEKGAKAREMELEKTRLDIENRRLLLEENRLSFEREQFLQRTREWVAAQDQRKEEHTTSADTYVKKLVATSLVFSWGTATVLIVCDVTPEGDCAARDHQYFYRTIGWHRPFGSSGSRLATSLTIILLLIAAIKAILCASPSFKSIPEVEAIMALEPLVSPSFTVQRRDFSE